MKTLLPIVLLSLGFWLGHQKDRPVMRASSAKPVSLLGPRQIEGPAYHSAKSLEEALARTPDVEVFRAVADLVAQSSEEALPGIIRKLNSLSSTTLKNACLQSVWHHWLRVNALAAWGFAQANSSELEAAFGPRFWEPFFELWTALDAASARSNAVSLSEPARSHAVRAIELALASRDPKESLLFRIGMTNPDQVAEAERLWTTLAENKGGELSLLKNGSLPKEFIASIVRGVSAQKAAQDPHEALQWAQRLPSLELRSEAADSVAASICHRSPQQAKAMLESLPQWRENAKAMETIAKAWIKEDAEAAMEWVSNSLAGHDRFTMMSKLVGEGMQAQPNHLAAISEQAGATSTVAFIDFATVGGRMADENPQAAWEWISNLDIESTANRIGVARVIASRMATENPEEAKKLLAAIGSQNVHPNQLRTGLLQGVAEELGLTNPEAGMAWIDHASAGHEATETAKAFMKGWVERDPQEAADFVRQIEEPERRKDLLAGLMASWSATEPEKAAQWLSALPPEALPEQAVAEAVRGWSTLDPMAASEWLAKIPPGENRDKGSAILAREITAIDPQSAKDWALSITNEKLRDQSLRQLFVNWANLHHGQAMEALNGLPSPEMAEKIRGAIKSMGQL